MANFLKEANRPFLFAAVAANLLVFYGVVQSNAILGAQWGENFSAACRRPHLPGLV